MFPFAGMPGWAQAIGTVVPATHFLRIVRKVMLKGAELRRHRPANWRAGDHHGGHSRCIAMLRYRQTLD